MGHLGMVCALFWAVVLAIVVSGLYFCFWREHPYLLIRFSAARAIEATAEFQHKTKLYFVTVGRAKTQAGSGRVIPLNKPAFDALVKWAGYLVESNAEDYLFPACEAAGIERKHPDRERIDSCRPMKSWRSACARP